MAVSDTLTGPHPLRVAFEARDFEGVARALSPDVVLHSPITSSFRFEGRDEVASLLETVRGVVDDLHYLDDVGDTGVRAIVFGARVGGQRIEGTDVLRLDEQGRVREIRVFVRPLAGLTAFGAALAPRLARRRGRMRAFAVARMLGPVALMTRLGDVPASRLVSGRKIRASG
jgi:SnoaL-like protein